MADSPPRRLIQFGPSETERAEKLLVYLRQTLKFELLRMAGADADTAEDLLVRTTLILLPRISTLEFGPELVGYAQAVARNVLRRQRRALCCQPVDSATHWKQKRPQCSASDWAEAVEHLSIRVAVLRSRDLHLLKLLLCEKSRMSVANSMGISPATLRSLICRLHAKCARLLNTRRRRQRRREDHQKCPIVIWSDDRGNFKCDVILSGFLA